jgi:ribosome-binding factor A
MATENNRAARVGGGLREELASLIGTEASDPRLEGVIVSGVTVSGDLGHAKVRIRLLQGGDDPAARARALKGLESASGFLRREVTSRLALRYPPQLHFAYDEGVEAGMRIEELLHEIKTEKK